MTRAQAIEAAAKRMMDIFDMVDDDGKKLACYDVIGEVKAKFMLRKALALPADDGRCKWKRVDGPYPELWETECCHVETILPGEMGWVFCPFCGKRIEIVKPARDGAE